MDSSSENITNIITSMDESEEEAACLFAMQLCAGSVLPMVLKSAIELNLLELIKKAGSAAASASELAAQLPTNNPQSADMIDRILRLLAANSVLNCSLKTLPDGGVERRYALAPVCNFLTRNVDGVSQVPCLLMLQDRVLMDTWYHLKDAVLEGGLLFNKAHGMSIFEYTATDPRFNKVFNQAMCNISTLIMKKVLEMYKGFEGLKSLVDVGGGIGASLNMILSKYPSIKAINFDLPHVTRHAPSHPGIEHIGGDMFVSVPRGDVIFMKGVCHDSSDAECLKILKNCYEALPNNGKVVIAAFILPETPNKALSSSLGFTFDLVMLSNSPGGKERTEKEFQALAKGSGFKEFRKVCFAFGNWIMEFHK